MDTREVKVLVLNIGNPSIERAKRQIEWLKKRKEDIFILTETKNSQGCTAIYNYFSNNKNTHFPLPPDNNYGVMCISNYHFTEEHSYFDETHPFYARYLNSKINISKNKTIDITGLYVPSRDQSDEKIQRKKDFLEQTLKLICNQTNKYRIICGDFNIIDRKHNPSYSVFKEWEYDFYDELINLGYIDAYRYCNQTTNEYSWVGRTGNGYRYDYIFVSEDLKKSIQNCYFEHKTQQIKISDHSAIILELLINL